MDIRGLLRDWPYDEDQNVRLLVGDDGHDLLQVRLPMGIEQYEVDGRPDGFRPEGFQTWLDALIDRKQKFVALDATDGFVLSDGDFRHLQQEAVLFYYRYVLLFQIHDFDRVTRDTDHNLNICNFVAACQRSDADFSEILQFRPYILRMNAVATAMSLSSHAKIKEAIAVLDQSIGIIENLPHVPSPSFEFEKVRSINYLRMTRRTLVKDGDQPALELEDQLAKAIEDEEFEKAAVLRDKLRLWQNSDRND